MRSFVQASKGMQKFPKINVQSRTRNVFNVLFSIRYISRRFFGTDQPCDIFVSVGWEVKEIIE